MGAAPIVPLSVLPQRSGRRDGRSTETSSSSENIPSPLNSQNNRQSTRPKQHEYQYFRQPRHSSYRSSNRDMKSAGSSVEPSRSSEASGSQSPSRTTSSAASESVDTAGSPSSSRGDSVDDAWNDTRSVPLGPRWNDYTYRESDAFYTVLPTPEAVLPSGVATASEPQSQSGMLESLKRIFGTTFHSTVKKPESSGFSVSRPARPQPAETDETGIELHIDDDATRSLV